MDAEEDFQFTLFDTYFAGLPAATTPLTIEPMLVFQNGTTKQVPASSVIKRTVLNSATTFYYATTGSDATGDGTITKPFATPQHTWDFIVHNIDANGFNITHKGADGTYVGAAFTAWPPNLPGLLIQGNLSDETKVVWQDPGSTICCDIGNNATVFFRIGGITLDCNTVNTGGLHLGAFITGDTFAAPLRFTTSGGTGRSCIDIDGPAANLFNDSSINIVGNYDHFLEINILSGSFFNDTVINFISTPSFSNAFLIMFGGLFENDGSFTGTCTGQTLNVSEEFVAHFGSSALPGSPFGIATFGELNYSGVSAHTVFIRRINHQTGSNYTLGGDDLSGIVEMDNTVANTVTVPASSTQRFLVGSEISIVQIGTGATTIQGAVGVTVHNSGALSGQWARVRVYNRATDEWVMTAG